MRFIQFQEHKNHYVNPFGYEESVIISFYLMVILPIILVTFCLPICYATPTPFMLLLFYVGL